jgi:hypothetical protein
MFKEVNEYINIIKVKVKQSHYRPWQALKVPGDWGSQILRQLAYKDGKVVSPTHRPSLPPGNILGTHSCYMLSRPQGHRESGRIMSMKKSSDTIGNRSRDPPVCRAVPQPLRYRAPHINISRDVKLFNSNFYESCFELSFKIWPVTKFTQNRTTFIYHRYF